MAIEIIAEAAQGFLNGGIIKALQLVEMSAAAGADAVKFQLVYADELCTTDYEHYDLFSKLEMPDSSWAALCARAAELNIKVYFDVFGARSLALACELGAYGLKIHSTDLLNYTLLKLIAKAPVSRVILAVGGTYFDEITAAVKLLAHKELILMHGFQGYPTNLPDNHLARINILKQQFPNYPIGFADHVPIGSAEQLWLSAVAIGAGVQVLEKHITTSVVLKEEDYESALNPDEFKQYVFNMQQAAAAMGVVNLQANDYAMSASETNYRKKMKKHVIAQRTINAGAVLTEDDLSLKRTSHVQHVYWDIQKVVGKRVVTALEANQSILATNLEMAEV